MEINTPDIVVTWVDGNDAAWQAERRKYRPQAQSDDRKERYRDWESLKYWFRGIEKYAGWTKNIFFVTWGHVPAWLNTENPKLHIVKHTDFIPKQYLPTYNSHTIELNLHRIKGLSENFVYFNDDVFVINQVQPEQFFKGGKPCDMLALQPVVANPANPVMSHIYLNNTLVLSKYFNKRQNIKKQWRNYFKPGYPLLYFGYNMLELAFPLFSGLYTAHGAAPLCRRTYETLWQKEFDVLDATCRHRFRSQEDVSPYLLREWQKLSGDFAAKNVCRRFAYFNVSNQNTALIRTIVKQKADTLCINDANGEIDFETAKQQINTAFEQIFPEKSSFEK